MDAYEWENYLWDRYCTKEHYLLSSFKSNPRYLTRNIKRGELVWDASENGETFIVTIHFNTETYCIKSFECIREYDNSMNCFSRPRTQERRISNINKSTFYSSFCPYITKDASLAKQSWDELGEQIL